MKVAVFHPGIQHSWQTAMALQGLDRLAWYATSIFYQPERFPYLLERLPGPIGRKLHAQFLRVGHSGLDPALVRTSGVVEWIERLATKLGAARAAMWLDAVGNRRFAQGLAASIASPEPFALWGYNGSSEQAFALARQHGRTCILDRTNGDFRVFNAMMDDVAGQYGEWFGTAGERAQPARQIATDQHEYELADKILVGSPFAARTIREATGDPAIAAKLKVLNYCFDEGHFADAPKPRPVDRKGPVKFLFLGLAIPRKGIHLLLEAISRIPREQAELTVVGHLGVPAKVFGRFADRITYIPTVSRSAVPQIMADHHVFMLPSYFEGAGITLYEALASGCALIQSRNCAEAVTPQTGIMLDQIDTDHVHAAMMQAIENRDQLDSWRAAAQGEAANYTFAKYRENIAALLNEMAL